VDAQTKPPEDYQATTMTAEAAAAASTGLAAIMIDAL